MSDFDNEQIFEAARTLRPQLLNKLGKIELVQKIDSEIAQLLNQADLEEDTKADLIRRLLEQRPVTESWLEESTSKFPISERQYDSLPGNAALQPTIKYICPIANDYTRYLEDGNAIPRCPTHLEVLVPAKPKVSL
jgi:hypothetical protein